MDTIKLIQNPRTIAVEHWYRLSSKRQIDIRGIIRIIEAYSKLIEVLRFNTELSENISLIDNGMCATAEMNCPDRGDLIPDTQPVINGTHVWRVKVENPAKDWLCYGVISMKSPIRLWTSSYGVSTYSQWYFGDYLDSNVHDDCIRDRIEMFHFGQEECEVDIYLNCDEGILKLCVVGMKDVKHEAQMTISKLKHDKDQHGWLPQIKLSWPKCQTKVRIAQISVLEYGIPQSIQWT